MTSTEDLPSELEKSILAAIAERPAPTRTTLNRRRAIACGLVLAGSIGWALHHGLPRPSPERPLVHLTVWLGLLLGASVASTWYLLAPRRSSWGPPRARRTVWLALAVPLLMLELLSVHRYAPPLVPTSTGHDLACLLSSMLLAGVFLAVASFVERRSDPVAPTHRAAALGLVAGLWAAWAVSAACPSGNLQHELLAHVGPVAVAIVVASVLMRRVVWSD